MRGGKGTIRVSVRRDTVLDEEVHRFQLDSGLPVLVHLKPGFHRKFALLAADFGSVDTRFRDRDTGQVVEVPAGVAHFLEHKLFEQESGDVFERFSRQGASANAVTSFRSTCYFMSCSERFSTNLRTLLSFVGNLHLTDASIEKERGIIEQEIRMYEDSAEWRCFMNLVQGLFVRHPVRADITGTVESIRDIDRAGLTTCYRNFYDPANLCLVVSGDVDPEEVARVADRSFGDRPRGRPVERCPGREPVGVARRLLRERLPIQRGKLLLGFKDPDVPARGEEVRKRDLVTAVLLALLFGTSSETYRRLYEEGAVDDSFYSSYACEEDFGFVTVGCETEDPDRTRRRILREIRRLAREGFRTEDFGRIIHQLAGRFVRSLDSMEAVAFALAAGVFRRIDAFRVPTLLRRISPDDVMERHARLFGRRNHSTSIVEPRPPPA